MDLGLKGKRALVTGGTAGIGFAIAGALAAEGASVVVASRNSANVERAVRSLREAGASVEGLVVDLMNPDSIRSLVSNLKAPVDILVNNSGGPATGNPLDITLEQWDQAYQMLLRSGIVLAQSLVPQMKKRGWGRLLTVTSTSARQLIQKLPVSSTFRAGLSAWTKELAKEVGRSGILVNNILPGPTKTERLQHLERESPDFYKSMAESSAIGRIAEPAEIARVAAFLCSAANTYLTGTDVLVDGGYTSAI